MKTKKKSLEERLIEIQNNPIHLTIEDMNIQKSASDKKIKKPLENFRFGLSALGIIFVLFALFYGYNTSSLEYREGVVTEIKAGGKSGGGRKGGIRYCNFKIAGDTTTYGYTCEYLNALLPIYSLVMDIKHLKYHDIKEGEKVGFWFKSNEKNRYGLYLADDYWSTHYKIYLRRKLPYDKAYTINIRGLSINGKIILKPQYYNYVRDGSFYPMLLAVVSIIAVFLGLLGSIFLGKK